MKTKFNVGIDASKFKSSFHTQSADASILRRDTFDSDAKGFEAMLGRFLYKSDPGRFGLQRMLSAGDLLDFVFPELRTRKITLASKGLLRLMLAYPTPK